MARISTKKLRKLIDGECFFCGDKEYEVLDTHRIFEGHKGGNYHLLNTLCVCCKCHRKVHAGIIQILGKYNSTKGRVIHFIDENGVEQFK